MSITWLINSYLAFCFFLFSMTTLLQLGIYFLYACSDILSFLVFVLHKAVIHKLLSVLSIIKFHSEKGRVIGTMNKMSKKTVKARNRHENLSSWMTTNHLIKKFILFIITRQSQKHIRGLLKRFVWPCIFYNIIIPIIIYVN